MSKLISKIVVPDSSEATGYALYNVKDANAIPASEKGVASGVATLDSSGKVPSSQLPSYVDDVIEGYYHDNKFYATYTPGEEEQEGTYSDEITPESGKIYVDKPTNQSYRWSGSAYIVISSPYVLPTASANTLGGVKVGSNLSIDQNGVLSAAAAANEVQIGGETPSSSSDIEIFIDTTEDATAEVYTKQQQDGKFIVIKDLNTAPTTSTLTYTENGTVKNFKQGDEVRVPDQNAGNGYTFYKLYELTTSGNTTTATWDKLDAEEIVQTTGTSTTAVMSQDAVTDELNGKLSLSGGTMTGELIATKGIGGNSSDGLLILSPNDSWSGISNTQWGVGGINYQGVIRSNNSNLIHYRYLGTSERSDVILDESNYSSYALPLSGGALSGSVTINKNDEGLVINSDLYESIMFGASGSGGYVWGNITGIYLRFVNGKVGVLKDPSSYSLDINGNVGATGYNNTSDIRKKDIVENLNLDVEDIANAPIFKFSWIDPEMPEGVNVGTSAQYWQTILPEIVSEANDDEKTLSMQYGVAGLVSSVALAKKVVEQEETIKSQEARIKALEDAIVNIQNKLNN